MSSTTDTPILSVSLDQSPSLVAQGGLCRRIVLSALAHMTVGSLRLELPEGTTLQFGQRGGPVEATIRVIDPAFFQRCVLFGDIGLGESYVAGEWETDSIKEVISWAVLNVENSPVQSGSKRQSLLLNLCGLYNRIQHFLRPNDLKNARLNIEEHYDLGNDFYRLWLDPSMTYSGARFLSPEQSLEAAQTEKYDALCRKLKLKASDRVLEIGCGWGGFSSHAARNYGCQIKAVTISPAQFEYAKSRFAREGIDHLVTVELRDYRHLDGKFDKIVSIEMMEALGDCYLETFCAKLHFLLEQGGAIALQYITVPDCRHAELRAGTDWIQKHIFPGSLLLSIGRINLAMNRTGTLSLFELEDLGLHYARTLEIWWKAFNERRVEVQALGFNARFIRKWNYYLQYCEAAFANRNISVVHAIYTRPNNRSL